MVNLKNISAPFLKNSLIALLGTAVISFLNYSFHLVVGRLLTPPQYGILQSFIALTYFSSVLNGGLSFSIIHSTALKPKHLIWPTVKSLENKFIKISLLFCLIFLSLSPTLKAFLHLENINNLLIFSLYLVFLLLPTVYQAILQARLKFLAFSLLGILDSLTKIIFSSLLILVNLKVGGALWGMIASLIATILVGRFMVAHYWQKETKTLMGKKGSIHGFWQYSFLSLITNLALISLFSSDILLVRHLFSPYQAGIYAAVAVLGKIIFFAASSILLVAFPSFVKYKNNQEKLRKSFFYSLLFLTLVGAFGLLGYKFFPMMIVKLLYNQNYSEAAVFLPSFALFISLLAIFNLFVQLLLSLKNPLAAYLAGLTAFGQILLILFRHADLEMVINNSLVIVGSGLLLGTFLISRVIYEKL